MTWQLAGCWPGRYGRSFSVARRLALLLTFPRFYPTGPITMRSTALMNIAVRVMSNLVTDTTTATGWRGVRWRSVPRLVGRRRRSADGRQPGCARCQLC